MRPGPLEPLRRAVVFLLAAGVVGGGGCGSTGPDGPLPSPSEACAARPVAQLEAGAHQILDPAATAGCLRIPQAGAAGAQYLLVLASTNGTRSANGIQGPYLLRASRPAPSATPEPVEPAPAPGARAGERIQSSPSRAEWRGAEFDAALRARERELLGDPRYQRPPPFPPVTAPRLALPPLGDVRTFKACANLSCTSFTTVTATARHLGEHEVIYVDNAAPTTDPLTDADVTELGDAFDTYHYPIDTTAFGRESDIDGNGVVLILMTKAVNELTPDCSDGRVVSYFFGGDLLTGPNSNRAEIFYTLVPAPATNGCTAVGRRAAINNLKPTLIHEFQHMISFNQHALVRNGQAEDTWLNEALSYFSEELGGRLIPASECTPFGFPSCRSQYISGDLTNSYDYAKATVKHHLTFPNTELGSLASRGAGWLFLRWVLDQFATDTIVGTETTRALLGTSAVGIANLAAVTGTPFPVMVPQWLMAIYLDDGPDLPAEPSGRLRYKSWGLRDIWSNPQNFPTGFPLLPPSITGTFSSSDTLKAGSGRHFLIVQQGDGLAIDLQVLRGTSGAVLDPNLQARFGLVRIR